MTFEHGFPFDPTGGYSPEELVALKPVVEEPGDFEAFWRGSFDEAMAAPLAWSLTPSAVSIDPEWEVFDVSFAGMLGNRVGGWLARPRRQPVRRGVVMTHGYGGREAPTWPLVWDDAAVIFPVLTGLPTRSLHAGIPSGGAGHVLHGIERRESYVHRFCVMDVWRAASVLQEAVPESRGALDYWGESFGGGIGVLALPWDARFERAFVAVPSFGNHPVRLGLQCSGSGEAVRSYARRHPEVREVLAYFDAVNAARHVRIPVAVTAVVFDPAVPPAGQFSILNALGGPTRWLPVSAGHFEYPELAAERAGVEAELRGFFAGAG